LQTWLLTVFATMNSESVLFTRAGIGYNSCVLGPAEADGIDACVLMMHCTGGNKGGWYETIGHISQLLMASAHDWPGRRAPRLLVIAPDFSGHGQSRPYPKPFNTEAGDIDFELFSRDAFDCLDTERARRGLTCSSGSLQQQATGVSLHLPTIACGHSMGASCAILCAMLRPREFSAMLLYEPIVMLPDEEGQAHGGRPPLSMMSRYTRKRRQAFPSQQEGVVSLKAKAPYSGFEPAAADAFLRGSLVPGGQGGSAVVLACDREFEAALYVSSFLSCLTP
jgi:pimeloyl-ACP methyl ester carboxylesterase